MNSSYIATLIKFIGANIWKLIIWAFCVYLFPTYELIGATIFLLIADFVTGIWAAYKRGEIITAKKMGATTSKMIVYLIGIISAYVVQHNIAGDVIKVMLIFTTLISIREFKSIIENIETISGAKIWSYIVGQISTLLPDKDFDKNKSDDNNNSLPDDPKP